MSSQTSASKQPQVVLTPTEWDTSAIKFMKPYVTKSGSKTISIISKQTNRALTISTPWMLTWGCSDFTDANGDSDGRFNISLNFPNEEYRTEQSDLFLQKLKDFENQILDDAVKMSETWWGEPMSREICKHTFFPVLKYSKNKDTNKTDYSKPPSFRAKVPMFDGVWKIEIYNTKGDLIFPSSNPDETPDNIITKLSSVACVLQSSGIWIGGKGWGVTWKLVQCAIKPKEVVSITGRCLLNLPSESYAQQVQSYEVETNQPSVVEQFVEPVVVGNGTKKMPPVVVSSTTNAEDTDDEVDNTELSTQEDLEVPLQTSNEEKLPLTVMPPAPPAPPVPVKKVIKKTVVVPSIVEESVAVQDSSPVVVDVQKKKVIKKTVVK
jgi:hypothetical protein